MSMRLLSRQERAGAGGWLLPFLIGFLLGVIVLVINTDSFLKGSGLLDEYTLGRLKYMQINQNAFFLYVLKKRLAPLWLLMLVSSTFLGLAALYGYTAWLGFCCGVLLSTGVIRYGMKGILLVVSGCLPHFILYAPAFLMLLYLGREVCIKLYFPHRDLSGAAGRKTVLLQWIFRFLFINIVVIIGALLESYVNPVLVTKILNIF